MRHKIIFYLLIFSVLFTIFIYINDKKILDSLREDITSMETAREELENENQALVEENNQLRYFSLEENEEALSYFEEEGIEPEEVIAKIEDELISRNSGDSGNELVPFEGMERPMQINKINILNHKWVIADFTDGTYWGEVFLTYDVDEDGEITFTHEKSFLYPVRRD